MKIFTFLAVILLAAFARADENDNLRNWGGRPVATFMDTATNGIHFEVVQVTGDYVISASEAAAMATTNLVFNVNTYPSNISITMPADFINTFTIFNSGTNWVAVTAPSGRTFLTAPAAGGITYSTVLNNKYSLKSQQFFQLNATNYVVSSDFRPLPNIIFDVTNNISIGGSGLTAAQVASQIASSNLLSSAAAATTNQFIVTNSVAFMIANSNLLNAAQVASQISSSNLVTATVTNGLATMAYANSTTNGFGNIVTHSATELATTNQFAVTNSVAFMIANSNLLNAAGVASQIASSNLITQAAADARALLVTNGWPWGASYYAVGNPSSYVTASVTNGLATTNYVNTATNALGTAAFKATGFFDLANAAMNATNGYGNIVTHAATELVTTNQFIVTNSVAFMIANSNLVTATVTNGLATTAYANSTTNTLLNSIQVGAQIASSNLVSFGTITLTNWVRDRAYTNTNGRTIFVDASVMLTNALLANSRLDLRIGGANQAWYKTNPANFFALGTNMIQLSSYVTNTGTFVFTNVSNNPQLLNNSGSFMQF